MLLSDMIKGTVSAPSNAASSKDEEEEVEDEEDSEDEDDDEELEEVHSRLLSAIDKFANQSEGALLKGLLSAAAHYVLLSAAAHYVLLSAAARCVLNVLLSAATRRQCVLQHH